MRNLFIIETPKITIKIYVLFFSKGILFEKTVFTPFFKFIKILLDILINYAIVKT